ncbi:MAG: hypothetical protein WBF04_00175 [Candidatus Sulfotelmatobacter sp.]
MSRIKSLLFLLALAAQVQLASATVTYVVGTCKPSLPSFTRIMDALGAAPAPNVVEVCPGTYNEQVVITSPVAIEGITVGNSTQAIIAAPPGGLAVNFTDSYGQSVAAQVLVENASGEVNLSKLTVDGTGNNVTGSAYIWVVGVLYANSLGTMNHLAIQNQNGNGLGVGLWLEGGSANPSVTLENSNLQGFDNTGIEAETNSSSSELTATLKENYLTATFPGFIANLVAIGIYRGATASVSGNLIAPGFTYGISADEGSVSKNTVVSGVYRGILSYGASVTSNTVYNTGANLSYPPGAAIWVNSSVAPVTGNTIAQPGTTPVGTVGNAIDLDCTAGNNVHSNTILGAANALLNVATGASPINTIYSVGTLRGSDTIDECQ